MSREKINKLLELGGEFWYEDNVCGRMFLVFNSIKDIQNNYDKIVEIDLGIDDTDETVCMMPMSVVKRHEDMRPATESELIAY